MDKNYRGAALSSLKKIFKDRAYSNIVIANDIKGVEERYRSIYRKSVLGTVENLMFIDFIINSVSNTKTTKMETDVLLTLRLAVYQIFFLSNSHLNVVVSESVQYIKDRGNKRASGFVNGVLRNIIRSRDMITGRLDSLNTEDRLSILYSYPVDLVKMWSRQFGLNKVEAVLRANNGEATLDVRVNTLKITKEDLINVLYNTGMKISSCKFADKGIIIENPDEIEMTDEYKKGLYSVQSESSMLAGQVLNPAAGSFIIDLCAAPGGKSFNAAEIMDNTGNVLSCDIHKHKIGLMEREAARLGISIISTQLRDASEFDDVLVEKADCCIVDVPCSGLGIIRRKPEIKYNFNQDSIQSLTELQYSILKNAGRYLKKGGCLVYSTCTVNPEENKGVLNNFLQSEGCFEPVDITAETKGAFETSKKGFIEIYPHIHHMDGFFIAKLKKI